MEIEFSKLYARASTGKLKEWGVSAIGLPDGTAIVRKEHGYTDGKIQAQDRTITKGKNIGKANETTPYEQALSEAESAWNSKKDRNYQETIPSIEDKPRKLLAMLAMKFADRKHNIVYPAFAQPKMNGVRDLTQLLPDIINHITRNGKIWDTLSHLDPFLRQMFNDNEIADGEIYHHDMTFQQIIRLVKKWRPDTEKLQYWVYDMGDTEKSFEERIEIIRSRIPNDHSHIIKVPTIVVHNEQQVYDAHDVFVSQGFEGVIIRNKEGKYRFDHRNKDLQKYKVFFDEEFEIIGANEADGVHKGCCIFNCKTPEGIGGFDGKGGFAVYPKGTLELRREYLKRIDEFIGKELTVRFQEKSEDEIPIFPIGLAVRDYE